MKVEGKGIVITGGSLGIGKAVALEFLKHGGLVIIADINEQAGNELLELVKTQHGENKAHFIRCDVRVVGDLEKAIELCKTQFGTFDIICNNAGIAGEPNGFYAETSSALETAKIIQINLEAVCNGSELAIQSFRKDKKAGVIINTASLGGIFPMPRQPVYAATKAAVIQFTRSLSHLSQENIKVRAICPTYTLTDIITTNPETLERMKAEAGDFLTADRVAVAFRILVEDDTSDQTTMRCTARNGVDYYNATPSIVPIPEEFSGLWSTQ